MLAAVGLCPEDLFAAVPAACRLERPLALPPPLDEPALSALMAGLAGANEGADRRVCLLGGGAYHHYVPSAVRHLTGRSEFYTAYTPYQPEISQGTLQALFEYQSMICSLTGMDAANASVYDGASAAAEAVLMAWRLTGRRRTVVSGAVNPLYRQVIETYLGNGGGELVAVGLDGHGRTDAAALERALDGDTACFVVQNPNFFGVVEDGPRLREIRESRQTLMVAVVAEPLSLGLLAPPGDWGADIVAAEGQSFGIPVGFGGPHLGIMACRAACLRQMPGRLVGRTTDAHGRTGYVLTLSTREQHIRRERATSNICSNEGLCALSAAVYLSLLGPAGLRRLAAENLRLARRAMEGLAASGRWRFPLDGPVFNEFLAVPEEGAAAVQSRLEREGFSGGLPVGRWFPRWPEALLFCFTETVSPADVKRFVRVAGGGR